MRCFCWVLLIVLLSSRQAHSFVAQIASLQQPSRLRGPHCGNAHGSLPVLKSSRSGNSSPDLDVREAAGDDSSIVPNQADAAITGAGRGLALCSVMEVALDALGASTQWVVASAVGIALVTRADVDTLVYVVGSLFNAVFSKVLKRTVNQVRPAGAQLSDPGMPSSHAMSLFYLGTYLLIGSQEHGVLTLSPPLPQWPFGVLQTQALLGMYAVTASLWRVKAGLHTLPQVLVGAAVGTVDAVLWYRFCHVYFSSKVEAFFGGPNIPVALAFGVCAVTFFTFGNAQRRISKIISRSKDA